MQIPKELFVRNRQKLAKKLPKKSLAIIHANDQVQRTGDQLHKFRQNSDLFYMTGIEQEKTILVVCPDCPDKNLRELLFILKADKTLEIWEGHKLTLNEATQISGMKQIKPLSEFDSIIHQLMHFADNVYVDIQDPAKFKHEIADRNERMFHTLKSKYPLHEYKRLANILTELRLIKEPEEIESIQRAIAITRKGFLRILSNVQPGLKEYYLEAELIHEFISNGAQGHAFHPIVASGEHACVLHYEENNDEIKNGDMVLLDFGAEYDNYSSDCSRTIPANGKYSKRQREMYDACLDVFKFARNLLKPGITINEWHSKVIRKWEEKHIELGLYSNEEADKPGAKLWFNYYMHGTGHFMGLDTHDVGGKDIPLAPGMILTCEPGIYVEEEGIGIRLENDILITEDGNMDLMEEIPIEPDEIEDFMKNR